MIPDQWQKVKELFDAALKRSPDERRRFVGENCRGDEAVLREVESLLANAEDAAIFLEQPAVGEVAEAIVGNNEKLRVSQSLNHYKIIKSLGVGGMGEVYLAEDNKLKRKVALKILPAAFAQDAERMRRFALEAEAVSALNHPNILTIYETGATDEINYIASEYVEGETLSNCMRREPLSLKESLDVAVQIASALDAAHRAGIIHRDIKPDNVMIRPDGVVKLLDFGIAKLTENKSAPIDAEASTAIKAQTKTGMIIGTANYMSPEQAVGKQIDARTDIFSCGVMLYEMLSGKRAFEGGSAMETIGLILHKEPVPLNELVPDVPHEIERIVGKALRKDRDERYQTAKDLLIDLKDAKQDLEFQNKLERSKSAPFREPAVTPITVGAAHTTSSTEHIVAEIRNHKLGLVALSVLLLAAIGLGYWFFATRPTTQIESIAVMPFANQSGNTDVEYLSDGMTETLISSLSQLPNLNVKPSSSVFRYKGKKTDAQTIGKELNVQAIFNGRVVERGQDLSLYVELIDVALDKGIWSQTYNRQMTNLVSLQTEIARDVSNNLKIKLSGADEQKLARNYTENAEAYQLYLRGRYFWNKRTEDGIKKAIEQFEQAIDRDPNYALGYVGLADSYVLLEEYGDPASKTLSKARAAADRALQLDNSLAEAHASSALIYRKLWRWSEAEEEFKRAISLNPNYATARIWFSIYFRNKRQFDDALREIKRAQELDPLSPIISANLAYVYILKDDLNSAVEQCKRMIELDPSFRLTHELLGIAYLKQHRYEEATAELQKVVELSKRATRYLSSLGYCYAVTGRRAESLAIVKELEEKYVKHEADGQSIAGVYAGLNDEDQAFAWLERDFEQRRVLLPEITWRFAFEDLRTDPRYADLVRRMGLPQ